MAIPNINVPKIITGNRDLEARIRLPEPEEGEEYTVAYLKEVLRFRQIVYGIDEAKLKDIIEQERYEEDIVIARGVAPIDGIDGYYEYLFDLSSKKKPKILPDGSVDYWSMYSVQCVQKGDAIAIYHPAISGTDGINVYGKVISAKRGREQSPLRGTGFELAEDGITYVSSISGKIDAQEGKIRILTIYEVSGDWNLTKGNIDFNGDIVIHGGVQSGISLKATGSITIDGVVESCTLEAGKDIILRKGMIGGNRAKIKTKGKLMAKFVEYTTIETDGDIEADVLLDCKVSCKGGIVLQGKRASIIGGDVRAVRGIRATNIGNDVEAKTNIFVGAAPDNISQLKQLQKKAEATREELEKIELGLTKFQELELATQVSYREDPRRLALLRTKIRDTALLAADEAEIKKLQRLIESGKDAVVSVTRTVFAGTVIIIRGERLNVQNNATGVEFFLNTEGKIRTRAPMVDF